MIRLLGSSLLMLGGWCIAQRRSAELRRRIAICGDFLAAAEYLKRSIRCESRPMYPLFQELTAEYDGEVGHFFAALLSRWEDAASLTGLWQACCDALPRWDGEGAWRELGRRLDGDGESLLRALSFAAEELTCVRRRLQETLPAKQKLDRALSLSVSAFLAVLLL